MQAITWGILEPPRCTWHQSNDIFTITLAKSRQDVGSWPHPLVQFTVGTNNTIWHQDKVVFTQQAYSLLDNQKSEVQAIRDAFSRAVADQLATMPRGPLGQLGFLFPQQGPHCLSFLQRCSHMAPVRKILRISKKSTGINILQPHHRQHNAHLFDLVACVAAGLAGVEVQRERHGLEYIRSITSCVGLRGGEYAAAVFAGVLRLSDALTVVKLHADAAEVSEERAVSAVRTCLRKMELKSPRIRLYSGVDGEVLSSEVAVVAALPAGACAGGSPAGPLKKEDLKIALAQQGVSKMKILVYEEAEEGEMLWSGGGMVGVNAEEEERFFTADAELVVEECVSDRT